MRQGWLVVVLGCVACVRDAAPDVPPDDTDFPVPAAVPDTGLGAADDVRGDTDIHGETGSWSFDDSGLDTSTFDSGSGSDTGWFVALFGEDDDGDGYGDALPPPGKPPGNDCDDANALVHPGAPERWYDGVDQDCDGTSDWDRDGDGHELVGSPLGGDDCDDLLATRHPALPEVCDGFDDDCDGLIDDDDPDLLARFLASGALVWGVDGDGDGALGADSLVATCGAPPPDLLPLVGDPDCDDADPAVHPHASDPWDGVDQDCDGSDG